MAAAAVILASASGAAFVPIHEAFNANQAYAYTAQIVGFGERQPGSPGHKKTEALIRRVLKKDGAKIETDSFRAVTPRGSVAVHTIIGKFGVTPDPKQPIFILAGHYDTLVKKGFVGANDGGSSAAILLAFADALAHQRTKMQIWLVWTDVEEGTFQNGDGLYGSRHFAQRLAAARLVPRIRGLFLLDMIGDKDLGILREAQSTPWLQDFIEQAAKQLGYSQYFFNAESAITDDHISFLDVGVPSVDVVDAAYGPMGASADGMGAYHHANTDTLDKISASSFEIVGRTILLTVELLDARN
jgi:glutaminyl-peptide cyclotransferase